MKTFTKRLLLLCTAVLMAIGVCAFAACGEDGGKEDGNTYVVTITVHNPDGTPNTDARVQLCEVINEETGELGVCWDGVKVDANGVSVQTTLNLNPVEVHIQDATGYKADPVRLDKDHTSTTITLREDDGLETYTVLVKVAGEGEIDLSTLTVKLTNEEDESLTYTAPVTASGVATFNVPAARYFYELDPLPAGFRVATGVQLTTITRTATITLTPATT